jgi:hypothetical protein
VLWRGWADETRWMAGISSRKVRPAPAADVSRFFNHPGMTFRVPTMEPNAWLWFVLLGGAVDFHSPAACGESAMSLGTILVIILIIFLLGGFSGRFGGYGYGMGHSGTGLIGLILVVVLILLLLGKL